MLNPVLPGRVAARALTGYRVFDTMLGALAQIVPERVPAAGEGGNSVVCISGLRPNRKPFIIVDMICGAWGGRPDKDGLEAVTNRLAEPLQHAGRGDGGRASRARRGIRLRAGHLRRRQMARRRRAAALLSHPGAGGAAAAAHRPRRVRALRASRGGKPGGRSRNFIEIGNSREPLPGKGDDDRAASAVIIRYEQAGAAASATPARRDPALVSGRGFGGRQDLNRFCAPALRIRPGRNRVNTTPAIIGFA